MQTDAVCATVGGIQFDDDVVGQTGNGRRDTSTGGQVDSTVRSHMTSLDDGHIDFTIIAITDFLCHLREVDVVVGHFAVVHRLTEIGVGSIGSTIAKSLGADKGTIGRISGRCTGEKTDLERTACGMFGFGYLCYFGSNGFRRTCRGKTTEAHIVTMLDIGSSFGC